MKRLEEEREKELEKKNKEYNIKKKKINQLIEKRKKDLIK